MSLPKHIIPGSDAAKVFESLETVPLTPANYDTTLRDALSQNGVDNDTIDAIVKAADNINDFPDPSSTDSVGERQRDLAQTMTANAVADPQVAANKAEQRVVDAAGKSESKQRQAALDAAREEAESAGGKGAVAEQKAKSLMDEGVSPEMAASAATAFAVAEAVAAQPSSGLQIFGKLTATVFDYVDFTGNGASKKMVVGDSVYNHQNDVFITATNITLDADHIMIKANEQEENVVWIFKLSMRYLYSISRGQPGYYKITGANFSLIGASIGVYGQNTHIAPIKIGTALYQKHIGLFRFGLKGMDLNTTDSRKKWAARLIKLRTRVLKLHL